MQRENSRQGGRTDQSGSIPARWPWALLVTAFTAAVYAGEKGDSATATVKAVNEPSAAVLVKEPATDQVPVAGARKRRESTERLAANDKAPRPSTASRDRRGAGTAQRLPSIERSEPSPNARPATSRYATIPAPSTNASASATASARPTSC